MGSDNIITITALNRYVRSLLESDAVLTDIRLRGEISNFLLHRTGHCYFSLKDEQCSVKAVMFRQEAQRLNFEPENGMNVIADCRISLYERDGAFQVYVTHMFPDGLGSIRLAFEKLKNRLEKEGLFEPAHKKAIPAMPAVIGVITSASGAALQDIVNVLSRRFPLATLLLSPVTVQGSEAAGEIAAAVSQMDAQGRADVMIVARGGGSAEDLWVFNDERIARAVYACRTPVISAVGHEIDFTILDFAADLRAPTPSAAAELAVPDRRDILQQSAAKRELLTQALSKKLQLCYNMLQSCPPEKIQADLAERCGRCREALDTLTAQLTAAAAQKRDAAALRLEKEARLASSLSPYAVLARGYAILRRDGKAVTENQLPAVGEELTVETACRELSCQVLQVREKRKNNERSQDL